MHIYVDADACPVIGIVERIAKSHNIAVTLLCDTNHYLTSDYSEVVYVGAGADAVDFKLISLCEKGDLVVTQDYGVAAMALSKGAYAIHQSGKWYTNENIDFMLILLYHNCQDNKSRICQSKFGSGLIKLIKNRVIIQYPYVIDFLEIQIVSSVFVKSYSVAFSLKSIFRRIYTAVCVD